MEPPAGLRLAAREKLLPAKQRQSESKTQPVRLRAVSIPNLVPEAIHATNCTKPDSLANARTSGSSRVAKLKRCCRASATR